MVDDGHSVASCKMAMRALQPMILRSDTDHERRKWQGHHKYFAEQISIARTRREENKERFHG